MIHSFKLDDIYLVYDVESGALSVIDELTYLLLNNLSTSKYRDEEITQAKDELDYLRQNGLIDGQALNIGMPKPRYDLKALCLHLSHDCNLKCKYCFASEGTYHGERINMPFDIAKKAIDMLIANSTRRNLEVDFFGGEPLINFEVLKQVVDYANDQAEKHDKAFKFTTTTNGVLLSKEVSDYLNEKMDNVVLSIDGRPQVNDNARPTINGKGSYDVIVDKFKYFRSIRGSKSYYVRGTFTHDNLDFCEDVLYLNDLGFDQISIEPVVLPNEHPMAIADKDIQGILKQYDKLAVEYVKRRKTDKWFNFFHFMVDVNDGPCLTKRLHGCGAGGEYLAIAPNGDVYPCHQFVGNKEYLVGNVNDCVLDKRVRDKIVCSNLLTKPDCATCWAKYHCSGGCSANAINFNHDINKPYKQACELMRKRLECALYIFAKEQEN